MQLLRGSLLGNFLSLLAVLDEVLGEDILVLLSESPPELLVEILDSVEGVTHKLVVHYVCVVELAGFHVRRRLGEHLRSHLAHLSAQCRIVPRVLLEVDGVEGLHQRAHGRNSRDRVAMSPSKQAQCKKKKNMTETYDGRAIIFPFLTI